MRFTIPQTSAFRCKTFPVLFLRLPIGTTTPARFLVTVQLDAQILFNVFIYL